MKRLLLSLAVLALAAPAANASFLIDGFDEPTGGASQSSNGSTEALNSPPNYFANRQMDGTSPSNLIVNVSGISGFIGGGQTAWIEWTTPIETRAFADLEFTDFVLGFSDISYDVTLNGTSINRTGAAQALTADGLLRTTGNVVNPGDTLRVTFTGGAVGSLGSFDAGGIQANPEPASALLLGGLMFGGICRFRRRRHTMC